LDSKDNYILFVLEGQKAEPSIMKNLKNYYFDKDIVIIEAVYGTVIYHLYSKLFTKGILDYDLDFLQILKENCNSMPSELNRDNVSEIYLFFDHDAHATNASHKKILEMLQYFNNETENGKLYISYPMVEALRHSGKFNKTKMLAKICDNRTYKQRVSRESLRKYIHYHKYSTKTWKFLVQQHTKRVGYLEKSIFKPLWKEISQYNIYINEYKRYIHPKNEVLIIAAFPIFLLDYFGYDKFFTKQ